MWGFGRNANKLNAVKQQMGRLINETFSTLQFDQEQMAVHGRMESRIVRNLPCVLFPAAELQSPNAYACGVTLDLSMAGLSILLQEPLDNGLYVIAVGAQENRTFAMAETVYNRPLDFGCYAIGLRCTELLEPNDRQGIKRAIALIEQPHANAPLK